MADEVDEATGILSEVLGALTNPTSVEQTILDISWEGIQTLLIVLQNTYKQVMAVDLDTSHFMNILKQLISLLQNSSFDKVRQIWYFLSCKS